MPTIQAVGNERILVEILGLCGRGLGRDGSLFGGTRAAVDASAPGCEHGCGDTEHACCGGQRGATVTCLADSNGTTRRDESHASTIRRNAAEHDCAAGDRSG
jgi:hypothetical protein